MSHLKTKFHYEYSRLLSGEQPWISSSPSSASSTSKSKGKSPDGPRNRYFLELLSLPVEFSTLKTLLDEITIGTLLDEEPNSNGSRIRETLNGLWKECLTVWRDRLREIVKRQTPKMGIEEHEHHNDQVGEAVEDDRRKNAIETLLAISLSLLSRKNLSSLDLIHILAGSMNDSDEVFNSLVSCIDSGLRPLSAFSSDSVSNLSSNRTPSIQKKDLQESKEAELRHLVLRLSLTWISSVSSNSLSSYFLRKDLFSSSVSFLQSKSTARYSFELSLFIGLLTTLGGNSVSQLSGVNNGLNNSPYSRRIRDWVDEESMKHLAFAMKVALDRDYSAYIEVRPDENGGLTSGLKWMTDWTGLTGKASSTTGSQTGNGNEFSHLPPPTASILLPLYLLTRSNQAFTTVMLGLASTSNTHSSTATTPSDSSISTLPTSFLTIVSYLFTHSSSSNRSRAYSRLSLLILCSLILDDQGSKYLFDDSEKSLKSLKEIKTCRQKIPILPFANKNKERKRLITSALDSCTLFLRHNLSRRLDVGSFILTLKFIQKTIQQCSSLSVRLEYDWRELWSSLFGLANFLVARRKEIKINSDLNELIKNLIVTLSISLVRSDDYLESITETRDLIYEFMRNSNGLTKLMLSLDPTSSISTCQISDSTADSNQAPSINSIPTKLLVSLPSWKPISKLLNALQVKLDDWSSKNSNRTPTYNTVQKLIKELDIETLFSGAEEDVAVASPANDGGLNPDGSSYFASSRKREDDFWRDREEEKSMQEIIRLVSEDVRNLMY